MIAEGKVLVNNAPAKASLKLRGGERISVLGEAQRAPLKAIAEEIPLDIVYEDDDLAVINKPAGMMVHAGAGATDDARNRGTLVNALLHHMDKLSEVGGELRPGIVHRLDKETSGLIVVAKNDDAHRKLSAQFARARSEEEICGAGAWLGEKRFGNAGAEHRPSIRVRRMRMTTRIEGGRDGDDALSRGAASGYEVRQVHIARCEDRYRANAPDSRACGGDGASGGRRYDVWGSEQQVRGKNAVTVLKRNFLHAAELEFRHPRTGETIALKSELPEELQEFLRKVGGVELLEVLRRIRSRILSSQYGYN